jgi:hypothetical protein
LAVLVAAFSLVGALTVPTTAFAQDDESQSASNNAAIVDESTNTLDVTSVFTKQEEDMNPPILEDLLANILKQDEDDKAPILEDLLANILEDVDAVANGGPVACCDPDCLRLVPNCEPPPPPVVVS